MKKFLFGLLFLSFSSFAFTSPSSTEREYDRFDKEMIFKWNKFDDIYLDGFNATLAKGFRVIVPDDKNEDVLTLFTVGYVEIPKSIADETCYIDWLVDGNKISFELVGNTKYKNENMLYSSQIPFEDLPILSYANTIEFRICSNEYKLSPKEVSDIRRTIKDALEYKKK